MGGGRNEAAVPTAILARRARGPARLVLPAALIAAFAGLCAGLLVGWSLARHAAPSTAPVAALPALRTPRPVAAPPVVFKTSPSKASPPAPPRLRPRTAAAPAPFRPRRARRAPEPGAVESPWWSTVVGDNPYR